ncbi:MAG: hypothetical protein JSV93_00170 [Candidatus Omnitrophota bacterium]|nr:MAG: hypothetical protein JSV93_00170 [Candidatus Omnitrophota bacterium]
MSIIVEALKKAQGPGKTIPPSRREDMLLPSRPRARKPEVKKRITAWIIASFLLLGVVSFYFLSLNLIKKILPTSPSTDDFAALREEAEKPSYVLRPVEESQPIIASLPMIPSPRVASSLSLTFAEVKKSIDLSGIMYTPEKPLVVVNGNVWGEGDYIGKFKISKIEKDFIRVTSGDQEFIVRLKR